MYMKAKIKKSLASLISVSILTMSCSLDDFITRTALASIGAGIALLTPITVETEKELGEETKAEVLKTNQLFTADPDLVNYVREVGNKLAQQSKRKDEINYQFFILEDETPNAFALPGGLIFVTTSLLAVIRNEAELAGVLGHEIKHVDNIHNVASIRRVMVAKGIEAGALNKDDSKVVQLLSGALLQLILSGYSRTDELEADLDGTRLASQINYASNGLVDFLSVLKEFNGESNVLTQYFQSHPGHDERIDKLNNFIKQNLKPLEKPIINESEYLIKIESLLED